MDIKAWIRLYSDLPSRQVKVPVPDKSKIICNDDETRVISLPLLQTQLDEIMSTFPMGRCFIRPSGTEDVLRVYAEAISQSDADTLALATIQIVHNHIGVLGSIPTSF
jgi:phosphoacetylglucosamine mutase